MWDTLFSGANCNSSNSSLFLEFITFLKPLSCRLPKVSSGAKMNQKLGSTMLKVGLRQLERFRPHQSILQELVRRMRCFLFSYINCKTCFSSFCFLVQGYFSGFIPRIPRSGASNLHMMRSLATLLLPCLATAEPSVANGQLTPPDLPFPPMPSETWAPE